MKRLSIAAIIVMLMVSAHAFGQGTGTLSGTVSDPSGALVPGVEVKAVNDATNVESVATTNASGVYNFAAIQPGTYTVRASLANFRTQTFNGVTLSANIANRLNFVLTIAAQATAVDVAVTADQLLTESSPSVGKALTSQEIVNLPNVTNNVLELINVMAGVQRDRGSFALGVQGSFAGVNANNINVMRDGISVNDQRWSFAGLNSATYLNQDMVGEMRMILAPVDAETGRGNGQVQITTRSGGNQLHGSAVYNIRNSALDARTWSDNRTPGGPPVTPWINQNQYTLSVGGPIKKNKTFFYAVWDQNISKSRSTVVGQVLSPCMQKGIFRYYDNWNNGPALAPTTTGLNATRASVDILGNPLAPTVNPDGSLANGILRHVSVFGQVSGTPTNDCSGMSVTAAPTPTGTWDPNRTGFDKSGVYDLLASRAPKANVWDQAGSALAFDGLNVVGDRWTRTVDGRDNLYGVGEPNPRKQINAKIDHIFTQAHKLSTSYTFETTKAADTYAGWPGSFEGRVNRQPQVISVNFTSTLKANMVNEARFGMSREGTNVLHSTSANPQVLDLLPKSNGLPVLEQWCTPQSGGFFAPPATISWCGENGGLLGARGNGPAASDTIDTSPRWTVADTLSWTSGRHSVKFGATFIRATSKSEVKGSSINNNAYPVATLGAAPLAPNTMFDVGTPNGFRALNPQLGLSQFASGPLVTNNSARMADLLLFLNGSLGSVTQGRFINSPSQIGKSWNDSLNGDLIQVRDLQQHEFNLFVKDDWKVTKNLTLNIGLRWDYYGVPYDKNGMTMTIVGGGDALFGRSGTGYANWMQIGERGKDVQFLFVGPNSPNPDMSVYNRDLNNFGPAVGFSYNIPWLGKNKTVFRGGYQLSYLGGGQGDVVSGIIENPPGSAAVGTFTGPNGGQYFNMNDVKGGLGVPVQPSALPVLPVPVTDRVTSLTVYAPNFTTPYIQNLTASVTHTFNRLFSMDVRYIGTLSRKQQNSFNLNVPNIFQNGLFQAFEAARAGGESALLDKMFGGGIDLRTSVFQAPEIVGQGGLTGAGFLRTDSRFNSDLANGNYLNMAYNAPFGAPPAGLAVLNYSSQFNPGLPAVGPNVTGAVLRQNNFPENFILTSPQFGAANLQSNMGYSNYHSMQAQVNIRPIYGITTSISYTWAKDLGNTGVAGFGAPSAYAVPWDRARDYALNASDRAHTLRSYGTFDLPVGPNRKFFANASGVVGHVAEGWQMSWIHNISSGAPLQVTGQRPGWYANSNAILVDPTLFNANSGTVSWKSGDQNGSFFTGYTQNSDPQCKDPNVVAASLQPLCSLNALYTSSGNKLVFRTPRPGEFSNFRDQVFGPGLWDLDMALSKRTRIKEQMSLEIRMDATNVFNHPYVADPNLSIQGGGSPFGAITSKNGSNVQFSQYGRVFQLRARLSF
jgi:hypothetical protein